MVDLSDFRIVFKSGTQGKILSLARSPNDEILVGAGGGAIESQIYLRNAKSRKLKLTLSKHTGRVRAIDRDPNGKYMVSAGDDALILVRLTEERRLYKTLHAHRNRIHALAFSPDGSRLASGSDDKTVMIRDVSRRSPVRRLDAHTERVRSLAREPNGKYLATASKDKSVIIRDPESREFKRRILHDSEVNAIGRKPDGSYMISGTRSGMLHVRKTDERAPEKYITLPYPITSVARHPEGIIAVGLRKGILVMLSEDLSVIQAYDLGSVIYDLKRSHDRSKLAVGIEGGVMVFGFAKPEKKPEEAKKPQRVGKPEKKPEAEKAEASEKAELEETAAPVSLEAAQIRDILARIERIEDTMKKLVKQVRIMNSMIKAIFEYITEMEEESERKIVFLPRSSGRDSAGLGRADNKDKADNTDKAGLAADTDTVEPGVVPYADRARFVSFVVPY